MLASRAGPPGELGRLRFRLETVLGQRDLERRRYQDLFEFAADGRLLSDSGGVVIEANQAAGQLLGRPAAALIGRRVADLLGSARDEAVLARRLPIRPAGCGEFVVEVATPAGEDRLLHVRHRDTVDPATARPAVHWLLQDLEQPVLEGEGQPTEDPALVRRCLAVYGQLVEAAEALLEVRRPGPRLSLGAGELEGCRRWPLEARLAGLQRRLRHWRRRYAELVRLDLDGATGQLTHGGRSVRLSRRERQLLDFLLAHPNRFFVPAALLARAWNASYLTEEQLRSYVVRLRQKLAYLEAPCRLANRRAQGYALVFPEGGDGAG